MNLCSAYVTANRNRNMFVCIPSGLQSKVWCPKIQNSISSLVRGVGSVEGRRKRVNRPRSMDLFALAETEESGSVMAMDVDDFEPLDMFGEGLMYADNKLADADFFNSFDDDFDDSDIN
ncbi:hypothetical protein K1719_031473 [Acacia pycnantha]|nr:hypothetical protein K1719_031473 [Acacia pycnantha]